MMERQEVLAGLAEVAVELLGVTADKVTEDARFDEDLDVDSLGLVEFVMAVEDRFDVKIPEEKLENIATVGQAADLVLELEGAPAESGAGG
ncbi:MAG: acyl carrier protein [Acidimicrobiales bacterium]|nr:acyl carrier protein [Actinomycetota bacterium]